MPKSEKLPDLEVEDVEAKLQDIQGKMSTVNQELMSLGIDHLNKITGRLSDNDVLKFRDSITYRLRSLRYHFLILLKTQEAHTEQLKKIGNSHEGPGFMFNAAEDQFSIFDSVIFHTCSLFDYYGYLCSYLCDSSNLQKRGWNKIVKAFQDPNNILSNCSVAEIILSNHREWIDKLYNRRSDLIHYKMDAGSVTSSWNVTSGERTLTVYAPLGIVKAISELRIKSQKYHITLKYVSFWLILRTLDRALDITLALRQVIEQNRRIHFDDEPIQFKKPDDESAT